MEELRAPSAGAVAAPQLPIKVQKITRHDDPEAFLILNVFERTATAASWPEAQWTPVLIPCLIRLAQQAMDTLLTADLGGYGKVRDAILQTLNLSLEAYRRRL